jgi:DNA-directed RNA polymerase specialized sigma24 family protein
MKKTNHRNAAIALLTHDLPATGAHVRPVLDAVVRAHRGLLVHTAEELLGEDLARDADDVVQDACLAVLEGDRAISPDAEEAFDDLHAEVARKAIAHRRRNGGPG